jgi:3-oxoacyl-[acyl-carrier protein] reductase
MLPVVYAAACAFAGRRYGSTSTRSGITETPMTEALPPAATRPVAEASPYKRLGRPSDIAAVVAFLCGPDAQWVTGQ